MKSHELAMAAGVGEYDDGAVAAVTDKTRITALNDSTRATPAAGEASFAPASVTAREHTLILTGELNGSSAHALEAEIEGLCEEGVTSITLDLRELAYIDSIGVAVIAFRCRLCQRRGYEFTLIPGGRMIHRAFEQAGVAGLLPFHADDVAPARSEREAVASVRLETDGVAPALVPALALGQAVQGSCAQ